jgi:lysophospholipase L1-like esterase
MRTRHVSALSYLVAVLCFVAISFEIQAQNSGGAHWVGTWAAAPLGMDNSKGTVGTADFTIRQIVHTSLAGNVARVVFTNEMGTTPLILAGAQAALSAGGAEIVPDSARTLTFNGRPSVTIPAGAKVLSDNFSMNLATGSNLAVSIYIPTQPIPNLTEHAFANQSNFIAPGNLVAAKTLTNAVDTDIWQFLSAVEVQASPESAAIVTLGDSITDGAFSTRSANLRWPDDLARRLHANAKTRSLSVLNEGIGGNRILHDETASVAMPSALKRFDRDVLSQAGVKYLIILEGINDIGIATRPNNPIDPVSADDLIFGLTQMIERAHTHGIKVFLGTIMPDEGLGFYYSEAGESERQTVNQWIRTTKLPDGVIDFDKALRDPDDPKRLLPAYDRDHIHPNDAGHKAMADAVDLHDFIQ